MKDYKWWQQPTPTCYVEMYTEGEGRHIYVRLGESQEDSLLVLSVIDDKGGDGRIELALMIQEITGSMAWEHKVL